MNFLRCAPGAAIGAVSAGLYLHSPVVVMVTSFILSTLICGLVLTRLERKK